jgi:hypothetical protein
VRATRARRLGRTPAHTSVTRWIEREMPLPRAGQSASRP